MVSFQCDGCGDTVTKPKLPAHYSRCYTSVTCIDCSKTFYSPAEFKGHTSCISEAEKYQGKLYKGKQQNGNAKGNNNGLNHAPTNHNTICNPTSEPASTPAVISSELNDTESLEPTSSIEVEKTKKVKKKKEKVPTENHDTATSDSINVIDAAPEVPAHGEKSAKKSKKRDRKTGDPPGADLALQPLSSEQAAPQANDHNIKNPSEQSESKKEKKRRKKERSEAVPGPMAVDVPTDEPASACDNVLAHSVETTGHAAGEKSKKRKKDGSVAEGHDGVDGEGLPKNKRKHEGTKQGDMVDGEKYSAGKEKRRKKKSKAVEVADSVHAQ